MPVTIVTFASHLAGRHLECGKKRGSPIANIIVSPCAAASFFHRQSGLGAIQCLYLAFLVNAKHHGILRWTEINADHVHKLWNKIRIARQLECFVTVGLDLVFAPDAGDCGVVDSLLSRHPATAPMCLPFGFSRERRLDDLGGEICARFAATPRGHLPKSRGSVGHHALSPESASVAIDVKLLPYRKVTHAVGFE